METFNNIITYWSDRKLSNYLTLSDNEILAHTFNNGCGRITYKHPIYKLDDFFLRSSTGLTDVSLPDSVSEIGNLVLSRCSTLQRFKLGKNVKSIGDGFLGMNSNLTELVVDEENSVYDSRGGCNAIIETATNTLVLGFGSSFIPNGVERIAPHAFFCCGIQSVVIPDSVVEIGDYAFCFCHLLKNVVLGKGVKKLGEWSFAGIGKSLLRLLDQASLSSEFFNGHMDFGNNLGRNTNYKICEYKILDGLRGKKSAMQIERMKILNRCLRSYNGCTMKDMCEMCGKGLIAQGLMSPISNYDSLRRTIYNDLKHISGTLCIEIEKQYINGHEPYYRYADRDFSLFEEEKREPINQLSDLQGIDKAINMLQQLCDIPGFEHMDKALDNLRKHLGINEKKGTSDVLFDLRTYSEGTEFIPIIQDAISLGKTLKIRYRNNGVKHKTFIVHPYKVVRYKGCWYLFCHKDKCERIEELALYKMEKVEQSKVKFKGDDDFDLDERRWNVIGVHLNDDMKEIDVELQFSEEKFLYVQSNAIHGSQKTVRSKARTICLTVIPNDEFYEEIMRFGNDVEIISPQSVREHMRELTQSVADKYT